MATFNIKLDGRRSKGNLGKQPVVVFIRNKNTAVTKDVGIWIEPKHWIGGENGVFVTRACPNSKKINELLYSYDNKYRTVFQEKQALENLNSMSAKEIVDIVFNNKSQVSNIFQDIEDYANKCTKGTAITYIYTLNKLKTYCDNAPISYDGITYNWLNKFDNWMQTNGLKTNTRGIVLRNIRVIYNEAIKRGIVSSDQYPFRAFKIKAVAKEKDFLRPQDIIALRDMKLAGRMAYTRDFFLLSLYLGGINPVDLFNLKKMDAKNKVSYQRQKIKDRTDSYIRLTVQPEAIEIVKRYADNDYLVNFINRYKIYRTFYSHLRADIRKLGEIIGYPQLTLYWARYTWATIADGIGISERLISKMLGHKESSLAEKRYIVAFNWDRIDDANREVLDHIFGKK